MERCEVSRAKILMQILKSMIKLSLNVCYDDNPEIGKNICVTCNIKIPILRFEIRKLVLSNLKRKEGDPTT